MIDPIKCAANRLYFSLLSVEITLKAILEHAGIPVSEIRARSHRLAELLSDLGRRELEVEVTPGAKLYVPASRLRPCTLRDGAAESTVGAVIEAQSQGAQPIQTKSGMATFCAIFQRRLSLKYRGLGVCA